MIKYNHALTVAFEVISDDEDAPTLEEALEALRRRLVQLSTNAAEAEEALLGDLPFDTFEFEPCPDCQRDGHYAREYPAGDTRCKACSEWKWEEVTQ